MQTRTQQQTYLEVLAQSQSLHLQLDPHLQLHGFFSVNMLQAEVERWRRVVRVGCEAGSEICSRRWETATMMVADVQVE